jgi:hypothetical protein
VDFSIDKPGTNFTDTSHTEHPQKLADVHAASDELLFCQQRLGILEG